MVFVTWTSGVVTGPGGFEQTHPCDSELILVLGGAAQCVLTVHDQDVVDGASLTGKNSAFTSTGITAPVFRLKGWWPRTSRVLAISPECEVIEIHVWSSVMKTWSSHFFDRAFCASVVSAVTPSQSSSYSVKPASIVQGGKRLWM